jgi:lipopolysaccharide/colanic/teichoic acid biosynthesis glycosyltransferase
MHLTSSHLQRPLATGSKRVFDMVAVVFSSPLWLPLCLLLALMIWLEDRHNPLFVQQRVGQGGQVFPILKFRSMVPHAEDVLRRSLAEDPELLAEWLANFKLKRDPRITRVGRNTTTAS